MTITSNRQGWHRQSVINKLGNLGILLVTIVALVSIAEAVVRYVFRDVTTTSDGRGYFAKRWYEARRPIKNSSGFREREFVREKPADVYRIAVIGDSITYAPGVEEEDRYTNLLQLHGSGKYEVLNFGRWGAETVDHVQILKELVLPVSPNFVLLQWFTNDVEGRDKSGRPRPWPLVPSRRLFRASLAHSALFFLVNERWVAIQEQLGLVKTYEVYMKERFADPNSPASVAAQEALLQFIAVCKQHAIPVGIVLFANPHGGGGPFDFLLDRVLSVCQREALPCLDTRSTFAPYENNGKLWVNRLDAHPGPLAHRLVAERIVQVFADGWRHP